MLQVEVNPGVQTRGQGGNGLGRRYHSFEELQADLMPQNGVNTEMDPRVVGHALGQEWLEILSRALASS